MAKSTIIRTETIERQPLKVFTEKAYLNYSMSVILDRALPSIGDGLKPVQRRIIYAMSELGLKASSKHKKSARTVGDVLGKYHPHGDLACYEAMVLMAQPFAYRYPLIDGQGNFGSIDDPKSFAAMRYTESRLAPYAQTLLAELGQGTVEWRANFDGTLQEPTLLPARLPNILLNGTSGIAVGMATDIPPHNLKEVVEACIHLLNNPDATLKEICKFVQAPDFPTKAEIITPRKEIVELYKTGHGSVRMRAAYRKENGDIVIDALPYQTSSSKIMEQIAEQMQAKRLPMVEDLRDESDHENPTRLVITPRSNRVEIHELMSHLFATTDLERSYRVNLNVIGINGKPQVKNLLTLLKEWLEFRTQTVRRRLQYRLERITARLHILAGLLIAYLNIDEVIRIIRTEDNPKPKLMQKFKLSELQAEAILELKLRHLAKLEETKIRAEEKELATERDAIEKTLNSKARLTALIAQELKADADLYGDPRRSPLIERQQAAAIAEEQMISSEAITVVLSKGGWARAAKGHEIDPLQLSYRAGDEFHAACLGKSNQPVIFLDSTGRSYSLPAHVLPSARGQGEPLTKYLKPAANATFVGALMGEATQSFLLASSAGYGFVVQLEELLCKNRSGKAVLKVPTNSIALIPQAISHNKDQYVAALSNDGHLLIFPLADLPILPRGKGNKIMQISKSKLALHQEYLQACVILNKTSSLTFYSGKRHLTLKPSDLVHYQGERGRRGNKLPRGFRNVEKTVVDSP